VPLSYDISQTADPFLAAALLPAMARGEPLEVDPGLAVSPRLLTNIATLQEIHHCWNPALQTVPIWARTSPSQPVRTGTLSFYSGGVDSIYTFLKRVREITHVVFIHGFDFFLDADTYQLAVERNSSFVHGFGKSLIPVRTNLYPFGYHYNLSRLLTQGSALASVALLLGFPRVYLPSTYSYDELVPMGSHPLIDPLWSSDVVEIVHDGAEARRVDKLRTIAGCAPALANLTVCSEQMNSNCGRCEKCLRTMIPLRLLGVDGPFPAFPPLKAIRKMRIEPTAAAFLVENAGLAQQAREPALRKALLARLRRWERRRLLKEVDRVLWGGFLRHICRRRRSARSGSPRIATVAEGI